ncbi:unannotated protein [freshwater metagenome]|uniref:Unannotated protein n=1 Tax=freshwater metagenome TaxID=449393 RepID=A0A6J5YHG8_9ZZZZ
MDPAHRRLRVDDEPQELLARCALRRIGVTHDASEMLNRGSGIRQCVNLLFIDQLQTVFDGT